MGALYNFQRLINKYKSEFKSITLSKGHYDECGDFVKGEETEIVLYGAIIKHRDSKIFNSNGTLTAEDRRLFTTEPIDKALQGSKVIYEGNVYSIMDSGENAKFTGVYSYTLKYNSAFKEGDK